MGTYLIKDKRSNWHKIGKAKSHQKRFNSIKTGNPFVEMIAHSDLELEDLLHDRFADKRVTGEWFDLDNLQIDECIEIINGDKIVGATESEWPYLGLKQLKALNKRIENGTASQEDIWLRERITRDMYLML